jgi:hypothetical protein
MILKEFKVDIYKNVKGKYEVHICLDKPKGGSHSWNYQRLMKEYPNAVQILKTVGFTNESRDLHMKEYGISASFDTKKEANKIANLYSVIMTGLNK